MYGAPAVEGQSFPYDPLPEQPEGATGNRTEPQACAVPVETLTCKTASVDLRVLFTVVNLDRVEPIVLVSL
jgi:hypothetical protein